MRLRFVAILALALIIGFGSRAMAEEPVAILKNVSGQVQIQRQGTWLTPAAGDTLYVGDVITTGLDATTGISFNDGTRLGLGAGSELHLKEYHFVPREQTYSFDIYLQKGSAAYSSGKLGKLAPESVKISTPQTTVGIRGTRFLIQVD